MGQAANSAHREALGISYPAGQITPEKDVSEVLAKWREKLRAPGRGLPPTDYSYINLEEVCEENAALLSRLRELGASPPRLEESPSSHPQLLCGPNRSRLRLPVD
ncbi:hypothetical protein E2562_002127 [Oryza meyeriana var. granulata]|uniref:Uncharacterized protein n=1 Tax=Oryza meyeriana var. granulata TaxID=110450 RepID=A0A6G1EDL7_9ORYZ|nr:hypothetical protein E2562_002127 [Oryza meyeriana var. granulata]